VVAAGSVVRCGAGEGQVVLLQAEQRSAEVGSPYEKKIEWLLARRFQQRSRCARRHMRWQDAAYGVAAKARVRAAAAWQIVAASASKMRMRYDRRAATFEGRCASRRRRQVQDAAFFLREGHVRCSVDNTSVVQPTVLPKAFAVGRPAHVVSRQIH